MSGSYSDWVLTSAEIDPHEEYVFCTFRNGVITVIPVDLASKDIRASLREDRDVSYVRGKQGVKGGYLITHGTAERLIRTVLGGQKE